MLVNCGCYLYIYIIITSLLVFSRLEWILDCVKFIPLKENLISIITSTIYYVKYVVLHQKRNRYKKILLENEINKVKLSVKKTPGNNKVKSSVTAVELKITSTT